MQMKRLFTQLIIVIIFCIIFNNLIFAQVNPVENLIKTGKDYTNLFQYEKALDNFQKACDMEPNNWEANYNNGITLIKLKRNEEAERYLSKAYKLNPDEIDIQKALGALYVGFAKNAQLNGQTSKKVEYQLKACHTYPAATKMWLSLFEQWWDNGEYKKIQNEGDFLYKKNYNIIELGDDANLQQALVLVAKAYHNDGDYAKADTFLNYASKIKVQNDQLYALKRQIKNQEEENVKKVLEQAEYYKNKKDYVKAIQLLKDARKMSSSRQSQIETQIEEIEKQISYDKYLVELDSLIKNDNYEKAAVVLEEALLAFPEDKYLLEKTELISSAIEEIEEKRDLEERKKQKQIEINRQNEIKVVAQTKAAKELEAKGDLEKAIKEIDIAIKVAPKNEELKKYRDELVLKNKRVKERQTKYINSQAEIQEYFKSKNYDECIAKSELLIKEYPEQIATISILLAESYILLENYEGAAKAVNPLASDTKNADLYNFSKGMYAYTIGNRDDAYTYINKVTAANATYYSQRRKIKIILFFTDFKVIVFAALFILTFIIIIAPYIKESLKGSKRRSMNAQLEKIKDTGNYEANLKFLEQRYEKEDVDNMKLVKLLYAAALQKTGDNIKAYKIINEYLKKDNRSPLAKNIAGETAMAIGETSPIALEQVQGLLKINENRKDAVEYLAKAYITTKADHKVAQEYLSKYIALNPNDAEAITYYSDVIISKLSYTPQTIKVFEKAIKCNPDKADYYVALMENYKSIGNIEGANTVQNLINEKFPNYSPTPVKEPYDPYSDFYSSVPQNSAPQQNNFVQSNPVQQQNNVLLKGQTQNSNQVNNINNTNSLNQVPKYYPTSDNGNTNMSLSQPNKTSFSQNQNFELPNNIDSFKNMNQNTNVQNQQDYSQSELMQQQMFFPQSMQNQQANSNSFPDYDNIGGDEFPSIDSFANMLSDPNGAQNLNNLIQPNKDIKDIKTSNNNNKVVIQGPKKNCPHCGAVNPANEYYCTSCGRPF